jgi:hypothetical protein
VISLINGEETSNLSSLMAPIALGPTRGAERAPSVVDESRATLHARHAHPRSVARRTSTLTSRACT